MRNRKQLPRLGYLTDKSIDVEKLLTELRESGLLNFEIYSDIKVSANSKHKDFVIANEFIKNSFFKEEEAESMEGDRYVQLYLTDFDPSLKGDQVELKHTTIFSRTRRLNPNKDSYLPEADELNYGVKNKHVTGMLNEIIDMFDSRITRVRLACLKPHFEIKPHVDYDPSYVTRYHIPLITNEDVKLYIQRNSDVVEYHMKADGKIYFFNSGLKHWVKNDSNQDRLHLIVDVHGQFELEKMQEICF